MSIPYLPLYVADYLSSTSHLSAAESGAYLHLLMHYWQKGALPAEDKFLARIARMTDRQWLAAKPTLQAFFTDGWVNSRLESERAKALAKAEARAEYGSRGGTAKALKSQDAAVAKATILPAVCYKQNSSKIVPFSPGTGIEATTVASNNSEAIASLVDAGAIDARPAPEKSDEIELKRLAKRGALKACGEWWNGLADGLGLPLIDAIKAGSTREKHTWARCREWLEDHDGLADMHAQLSARIRGSPLLRGDKGGWAASFDWVMCPTNFQKVMDGNYEDRKAKAHR